MTIRAGVAVLCAELLLVPGLYPFPQLPPGQQAPTADSPGHTAVLTSDQLDSLVAPIALYPDPILSQVLVASTYPLEIVQAARWLEQNSSLQGKALSDAAAKQPWDASVQALVMLPDLLKQLNQNISWTSDLGNAFLAQQQDVFNAIQAMRRKAEDKGALKSSPQQTVSTSTQDGNSYIEIQPASPEVVYIPQYNPEAIWGAPAVYPYPPMHYPPVAGPLLGFGAGMALGAIWAGGWNNWGWNAGWGGRNVIVNNNFFQRNNYNRGNYGRGNSWRHNPEHRRGVPYNNRSVSNRYNPGQGNRPAGRPTPGQVQGGLNRPGQRPGASYGGAGNSFRPPQNARPPGGNAYRPGQGQAGQGNYRPAGDRIGNRNIGAYSGGGAFAGYNRGGSAARMSMGRGYASRGGGYGGFRGGGSRGGGFRGGGYRGGGFRGGGRGGYRGGGGRGGYRGGGRRR